MAKTDWTLTDTVKPDDFNNIGREINQLRTDVDHIEVPTASLTEAGIVQLSNATNSTNEAQAATSKAVKAAYDAGAAAQTRADQAFQLGNERKAEVVAALVAKGISASTSESWDSLIAKMAAIIKATGNAGAGDVLSGKTFSNQTGNYRTGTMVNQGAQIITPGIANKAIQAGYHNGSGHVLGDPDLIPANFPKDVNLFGIQGILERMTTAEKQSIANQITGKGVPASVNDSNTVLGQKIEQIFTGIKLAKGSLTNTVEMKTIANLAFKPQILVCYLSHNAGFYYQTVNPSSMEARGYVIAYNLGSGVEYGSSLQGYLRDQYDMGNFVRGISSVTFGANSVSFNLSTSEYYDVSYIVFGN